MEEKHKQNSTEKENSCKTCILPAACAALSPYFVKNALLNLPETKSKKVMCEAMEDKPKQKPTKKEESCKTCLYTGTATCAALSTYFVKTALLDLPETGSEKVMREATKQKRFLLAFGGAWAIAGAYRWHLG